jgi:PAS domain S-box-containing protein
MTDLDTSPSASGRSPADEAPPIRVLLAEDEEPLRSAISDLVTSEPGLEIVGAVGDASEAIELATATTPDVALVDVRMPGGGAAAAKGIRSVSPGTQVVALSAYEDKTTVLEMLDSGAVAYLVKGISPAEIVEAIRRAARGQASLSAEVISAVIKGPAAEPEVEPRGAEALRHTGERFRGLIDAAPDAVVLADEAGMIVLVNSQTEELFGYDREALIGQPIETLLPGYLREAETRAMGAGLDLVCHRRDGSEFPVEISLSAMEAEEGRLVIAFVRDITDRQRGESATLELAAIVASSSDAIVSESLDHRALTWNSGAEMLYGYSAEEMPGKSMSILVPPGQLDEVPAILERFKSGEQWIDQFETTRLRKDGSKIEVSIKISPIRDASGTIVGLASIARDLTPLRVHRELERDLAERRALLAHLVDAGEEERGRIAMDIHDDSIQAITAAGMRLQILRRRLDDPEELKLLDELEQTIQLAISRLRHLLFELRPPALDNEGLSAALGSYLAEVDEPDIAYRFDDQLSVQPSPESRTILYRIVQEALTNVRKHAQAGAATVALREVENGFLARVSDDGVGFVAGDEEPVPGHLGLAAMRERAELAGGWLKIKAAPGKGTTLEVWIPVAPPEASPSGNGSEG